VFSPHKLQKALSRLLQHHDILRASYHYDGTTWTQSYLPVSVHNTLPFFLECDLSHLREEDFNATIHKEASQAQKSLNIEQGNLLKAVFFHGGDHGDRLLLVIHHLAIDGVSWRILLEDLQHLLEEADLPPKTHAFRDWGEALKIYASSEETLKELPYWIKVEESLSSLPTDFPPSHDPLYETQIVSLTKDETALLLREVPKAYRTEINDVLLTALLLAVGDWVNTYSLSLLLEGHGREDIIQDLDISRTLGWFTSAFPVSLHLEDPSQIGEALKTVKEQLREIPKKGIGYGILRYLLKDSPLKAPLPKLSFNYLGQWDTTLQKEETFSFAKESTGDHSSPLNREESLLNLNGSIQDGTFYLSFGYDCSLYSQETIKKLSLSFINRLREIIKYTTENNVFGYTPSDFELVKDIRQVDLVYKILGQ
jgi:non-ribosomal peptide synthase protein (TIGR01720 family)